MISAISYVTVCLFTGLSLITTMIITMAKLNKMCWLAFEVLALPSLVLYHRPPCLKECLPGFSLSYSGWLLAWLNSAAWLVFVAWDVFLCFLFSSLSDLLSFYDFISHFHLEMDSAESMSH